MSFKRLNGKSQNEMEKVNRTGILFLLLLVVPMRAEIVSHQASDIPESKDFRVWVNGSEMFTGLFGNNYWNYSCCIFDFGEPIAIKRKHRRYGYRRITEILCKLDWIVNHKRVYRIWRRENLRLPQKRQKKKRYNGNGLNACDRRPPEYMNHIWSYDIMEDRLEDGRKIRILNVIDEFTRKCLASDVCFSIKQHDVIELLRYLFLVRG